MKSRFVRFLLIALGLASSAFAYIPNFIYKKLPLPIGDYTTCGSNSINNHGDVLGWANGPSEHSFVIWRAPSYGAPEIIGNGWHLNYSVITGSDTVGVTHTTSGVNAQQRTYLWNKTSGLTYASPNNVEDVEMVDLNNQGDALICWDPFSQQLNRKNRVRLANGNFVTLTASGGAFGFFKMNDSRQIVGVFMSWKNFGVLYDGNTGGFVKYLPMDIARVINHSGEVGGLIGKHALIYSGNSTTTFAYPVFYGPNYDPSANLIAINSLGNMIGTLDQYPAYFDRITNWAYKLSDIIPLPAGSSFEFTDPVGINDSGVIAGTADDQLPNGKYTTNACILTPHLYTF